MCKLKKNGGGDLNSRYKTYTAKIWKDRCKHNKNGGGGLNSRYETYTDKCEEKKCKLKKNDGGDLNSEEKKSWRKFKFQIWDI